MVNWIRGKTPSSTPILLVIMVLAIATAMIVPNYITGQWAWSQQPTLPDRSELRAMSQTGLSLPGWHALEQHTIELGHKPWSVQALKLDASATADTLVTLPPDAPQQLGKDPIFLFLRPQSDAKDEPLVEWIDFDGFQQWNTDQRRRISVPLPSRAASAHTIASPVTETAETATSTFTIQYSRGWNQYSTYAVMQWYAWPTGGSPKISTWFWADQWMQWRHHQRMPWIAVTVLLPIQPLADIAPTQPLAEAIAQTIQTHLNQTIPLAPTSS